MNIGLESQIPLAPFDLYKHVARPGIAFYLSTENSPADWVN